MSYKDLKTYQNTKILYDYTVVFTEEYVAPNRSGKTDRSYRTADQMVQAARSGKQNIVEGAANKTSAKSEIKLTGVARASLEELLEDYSDFLRQRELAIWSKDSQLAKQVRQLAYKSDRSYKTYSSFLAKPESAANAAICLLHQTNYLLDKQISALEERFVEDGGYTENLFKRRLDRRQE